VFAVGAVPMEIQLWEGVALRGAGIVLEGTTHDMVSAKSDSGHKVWRKLWVKKHEEGIDRATTHNSRERSEEREVFELLEIATRWV